MVTWRFCAISSCQTRHLSPIPGQIICPPTRSKFFGWLPHYVGRFAYTQDNEVNQMFIEMPKEKLKDMIRGGAYWFAKKIYLHRNPGATLREANEYARRFWRLHLDDAITCMAICDAVEERDAAAPWN